MGSHGGKRQGAGAKKQAPTEATRRTYLVTPQEHQAVREFIKRLREDKKDTHT